eukprot:12213013-Alexandrium_andersonii.AAC.1
MEEEYGAEVAEAELEEEEEPAERSAEPAHSSEAIDATWAMIEQGIGDHRVPATPVFGVPFGGQPAATTP